MTKLIIIWLPLQHHMYYSAHLLAFRTFSLVNSSHFNRNPCDLEFCVRFDVDFTSALSRSCIFTNKQQLSLKATSYCILKPCIILHFYKWVNSYLTCNSTLFRHHNPHLALSECQSETFTFIWLW